MANSRLVNLFLCHTTHEPDEDYRAEKFVPRNRTVWIFFTVPQSAFYLYIRTDFW